MMEVNRKLLLMCGLSEIRMTERNQPWEDQESVSEKEKLVWVGRSKLRGNLKSNGSDNVDIYVNLFINLCYYLVIPLYCMCYSIVLLLREGTSKNERERKKERKRKRERWRVLNKSGHVHIVCLYSPTPTPHPILTPVLYTTCHTSSLATGADLATIKQRPVQRNLGKKIRSLTFTGLMNYYSPLFTHARAQTHTRTHSGAEPRAMGGQWPPPVDVTRLHDGTHWLSGEQRSHTHTHTMVFTPLTETGGLILKW